MQSRTLSISLCSLVFTFAFTATSLISHHDTCAGGQTVNTAEVQAFLQVNPKWRHDQGSISRIFSFEAGFKGAIEFVRRLVEHANRLNHHPDLKITYNHVTLMLATHDAGELTKVELELATIIMKTFNQIIREQRR